MNDGEAITDRANLPTDLYKSIKKGNISSWNVPRQLSQATKCFPGMKIYHSEILKACIVIAPLLQYCQRLTVILRFDTVA